jgi:hypothetical protein
MSNDPRPRRVAREERASRIQRERDHDRGDNTHAADGQLVHSREKPERGKWV